MNQDVDARVTMFVEVSPDVAYSAFVEPAHLSKFWLEEASAPLRIDAPARWRFPVEGVEDEATATEMETGRKLAWKFSDGSTVLIDFEAIDGGTAVTIVNGNFPQKGKESIAAALNATEGFALVLADLKTYLESGRSAGIVRAKAKLIEARGKM